MALYERIPLTKDQYCRSVVASFIISLNQVVVVGGDCDGGGVHSLNHLHVYWYRQPRVFCHLTSLFLLFERPWRSYDVTVMISRKTRAIILQWHEINNACLLSERIFISYDWTLVTKASLTSVISERQSSNTTSDWLAALPDNDCKTGVSMMTSWKRVLFCQPFCWKPPVIGRFSVQRASGVQLWRFVCCWLD